MPAQPYWQSAGECGGEGWVEEGRDEKVSGLSYCFEESSKVEEEGVGGGGGGGGFAATAK